MPTFVARVQIHDVGFDYTELHKLMRSYGFIREIVGQDHGVFSLPHAEYIHVTKGNVSAIFVRDFLASIVGSIAVDSEILVMAIEEAAWSLRQAPPDLALTARINQLLS